MLARKRFEISYGDLFRGMLGCCRPLDRLELRDELERLWSGDRPDTGFACLSVRSALDLYLTARSFPPGSEIVFTGANIPDMARVVREHGLVPVPVDFDLTRMAPSVDEIDARRTSRTKAVLFAQLFGGVSRLDSLAEYCAANGLDLIEDDAQAYLGPSYRGAEGTTLSLFSFGPIKSATALAGALVTINDSKLRASMREVESTWTVADTTEYFTRLVRYTGLSLLTSDAAYGLLAKGVRLGGRDLDSVIGKTARSFPSDRLMEHLRRQPSAPLLELLLRRHSTATDEHYRRREALGRRLAQGLGEAAFVPGLDLDRHSFWVYPILTAEPDRLVRALYARGLDATRLATLAPLADEATLPQLHRSFAQLVYLPFDQRFSESTIDRIAATVRDVVSPVGIGVSSRNEPDVKPATNPSR